jgi:hypothetical protein
VEESTKLRTRNTMKQTPVSESLSAKVWCRKYDFAENVIIPILSQSSVAACDEIKPETTVIALYPNSSCFYSATVIANPGMTDGEYIVVFVDDNGMERTVSQQMVLEVPPLGCSSRLNWCCLSKK